MSFSKVEGFPERHAPKRVNSENAKYGLGDVGVTNKYLKVDMRWRGDIKLIFSMLYCNSFIRGMRYLF